VRTIKKVWLNKSKSGLEFEITADGFLYHMVRNIVGTLLQVGRGQRLPEDLLGILASGDRNQAGPTAPPQGLYLVEVGYTQIE
jgi:tRNA pseudouridine38-40 synthase